jgi:RNA polymerase sigma factor (sigma-70 family)
MDSNVALSYSHALVTDEPEAPAPPQSERRLRSVPPPRMTYEQALAEAGSYVESFARRYARFGVADYDDCLQQARLAVMTASSTWLPEGGASFVTWAIRAIRSKLGYLLSLERRKGLTGRGGRVRGAADELGRTRGLTSSMDAPIGEERSLHDVVGTPAEQEDAAGEAEINEKIRAAVERLPERDRMIWTLSNEGLPACELGPLVGLTGRAIPYRLEKIADEIQTLIETGEGDPGHDNRDNRSQILTHDGVTLSLPEWARRLGVLPRVLSVRLQQGWSVERTLTTPKKNRRSPTHAVARRLSCS